LFIQNTLNDSIVEAEEIAKILSSSILTMKGKKVFHL